MPYLREMAIGALCVLGLGFVPAPIRAAPDEGAGRLLTAAYDNSGQELFRKLAEKPGNIVLSPYSIGTAMAMALAGARGENEAEMARILGLQLSREQVNSANAAVLANLNAASSAPFQILVANAVMLAKKGDAISEAYVATLRDNYAAEVFRGADLATVNGWVEDKTKGKIDSILDQLDPSTALILLDAIYFKAPWQTAFNAKATRDEAFHLVKGEANVPMMQIHGVFSLAERPGYRAIRLPYAGGRIGMVVMLPDADAADLVQRLDGAEMQALLAALHGSTSEVDVSLPRFHASYEANLTETFTELGMHRAFDASSADFSGMTGKPPSQLPLAIDQIVHRAVIDVAEQGTEAAAVTGVSVVATAMAPRPSETFRVDRPFLFAIIDDNTGAILFEGRIVDPR
jgi:serpin B